MEIINKTEPTVLVIFGGSGDLTWRKLMPALYNLYITGMMPEKFMILVVDIIYEKMCSALCRHKIKKTKCKNTSKFSWLSTEKE